MLEMIVGSNGTGKTKYLLDVASNEIGKVDGNIAFLDKGKSHMYELNNRIRLIDVKQYNVKSNEEFIGFVLGLLSQDRDLEIILIDSFLKLACLEGKDITATMKRLDEVGREFNVRFVISVGLDENAIPAELKDSIAASL
ncbi:MAG: ATP-binding protein [Clostridiales bacterium]|nr:ATP-binding protein [Clostridiales bacterium]